MNTTHETENKGLVFRAIIASFLKLNPREEMRNPVMFLTYVGAIITAVYSFHSLFNFIICVWLWFTVIFANFAEALAEGRGKAQADSLKRTRSELCARLLKDGKETKILASKLRKSDVVVCEANDIIPCDGEVIEGIASVDESAITGESAPVIRESGGDRSAVTGGTRVISDRIVIQVTVNPGDTFLDRIILLIESAKRQKTPNEIALSIVLSGLSIIFLLAVISLKLFADYSGTAAGQDLSNIVTVPVLVALLVCLIPTTIGGLLSAIGIAGMDRLIRRHIIAKSGRSIEAAGDIDVLLLDKTGTITIGNRMASEFIPAEGIDERSFAEVAQLSSLADETPEGRSIVVLAKEKFGLRARTLQPHEAKFIPFSANTQMSGIDFIGHNGEVTREIKKGAVEAITKYAGKFLEKLEAEVKRIASSGGTPLAVAEGEQVLGIIHLKDIVKGGIKERFKELRAMGIKTVMITGDNPLTAAAIAAEAGVDDFIAQATPESKLDGSGRSRRTAIWWQ